MANPEILSFAEQKKIFFSIMRQKIKPDKIKVFLIIVANTLDPVIGEGCKKDINTVHSVFSSLGKHEEYLLSDIVIADKDYSMENVIEITESLRPGPNDVVVFYYTGHGFRFKSEQDKRSPQMDLQSAPATNKIQEITSNTKNLQEIFEIIKSKGARLNLVIGDCCNHKINFKPKFSRTGSEALPVLTIPTKINDQVIKKFFCEPKSSILVSSADIGQLSIVDEEAGSIFTAHFAHVLCQHLHDENFDHADLKWEKLLHKASKATFDASRGYDIGGGVPGDQQAFYDIDIDLDGVLS
jgi:hypothetical protein